MILGTIRADLHSHTTASDGALSPAHLVREAAARGITHLGVSDHDTMAAIPEARATARECGITVVPCVEITCKAGEIEIHMLGIGVRPEDEQLLALTADIRERRRVRYLEMIERLRNACGLTALDAGAITPDKAGTLGRPELARALVRLGHAKEIQEVFDRWLGRNMPAYVPNSAPDALSASRAIRGAGGAAVLAHCGLYRNGEALAAQMLTDKIIDGIEIVHPDHSGDRRKRLFELARQHNALVSGGADFHQFDVPKAKHFGRCYTPEEHAVKLFERVQTLS